MLGEEIILANDRMEAVFRSEEDSWYLSSIRDLKRDVGLLEAGPGNEIWSLSFVDKGEVIDVPGAGVRGTARETGEALELEWGSVDVPGGEATVRVAASMNQDTGLELKLGSEFDPASPLWEVKFPVISGLKRAGSLYAPWGYGKSLKYDEGLEYEGKYPGHHCNMQFLGWKVGDSSLYIGCHDPGCSTKYLSFDSVNGASISFRTPVPDMGERKEAYSLPHATVVDVVEGDPYDVAQRYRRWAFERDWSSGGTLDVKGTPGALTDICLWCRAAGSAEQVVPSVLEFADYFSVPVAVHWYSWHEIPFDDSYPDYFPPKPGFKEGVRRLVEAGIPVMPYINARLWDSSTESWRREDAESAAAKNRDLEKYVEVYASKVPLSPMCPTTSLWREKIGGIVSRLARDYGVSGVYLDQIGAASPKLCFDRDHGHPAGGGSHWVRGYREMLQGIRRELKADNPHFFITTESNAEPWNDLLDGQLMCNSTEGELVPLYPAVYGDMIVLYGSYIFRSDLEEVWPFRTKISQMFLWGTQLGWMGCEILEPEFRAEAEYLRSLAEARHSGHELMTYGRMLRPPGIVTSAEPIRTTWKLWNREWEIEMPPASATAWRWGSSLGIAACNMEDREIETELRLRIEPGGITERDADRICGSSDLSIHRPEVSDGYLNLGLQLGPRSARIVDLDTAR